MDGNIVFNYKDRKYVASAELLGLRTAVLPDKEVVELLGKQNKDNGNHLVARLVSDEFVGLGLSTEDIALKMGAVVAQAVRE